MPVTAKSQPLEWAKAIVIVLATGQMLFLTWLVVNKTAENIKMKAVIYELVKENSKLKDAQK